MTTGTETEQRCFVHSALFYHSQREYLDFVLRFVSDGMAADEPVMVAVPGDKLAQLRRELSVAQGGSHAELRLVDITDIRNPSRLLAIESAFAERYGDQRVRIVSQLVWPGRTEDECLACVQHEALVNGAFAKTNVLGLCLYDAERLEEEVLAGARRTHPLVWKCGSVYRSAEYAPEVALDWCNQPLTPNPSAVTYTVTNSAGLRPARSFATDYAGWVGLAPDAIEDLQMIATELATNSLQYAGGACRLAFWRENEYLVCEARDSGQFKNLLVGAQPPGPGGTASRGLFLVNAMADLVRTHTTASGTTIQAYLRLDAARSQAS